MKEAILKILKTIVSDARQVAVPAVLLLLVGGAGTLLYLSQTVLSFLKHSITISTPIWATTLLVLLCCLYTYLKVRKFQYPKQPPTNEELREEFGVYWNNQYKLRCLSCKHPLHPSSKRHDSSIFFCSNCNRKYSLRDQSGNHLNEAQAVELLKNC